MSSQERWPPTPSGSPQASSGVAHTSPPARKDVFEGLATRRRRRIVAILMDGSDPVEVGALATRLGAVEDGVNPVAVPEERSTEIQVDLRHVQLPALSAVGLLEWNVGDDTVAPADHPAFDDPAFRELVETTADVDDVVDCLASPRRRLILAVLRSHDASIDRDELAREVAAHEPSEDPGRAADDVLVSLHHAHLPKLEAVGLVEQRRDDDTVAYRSHPDVDEAWFAF